MTKRVCVVLPALNEADALPAALEGRPADVRIIVVDNGSTDDTATVAAELGVEVVVEPQRGFGAACKRGLDVSEGADVIAYMDADHTCAWEDLDALTAPILAGNADLVLGRRRRELHQPGAMAWHVGVANRVLALACRRLAGVDVHDVPPYRAIRRQALVDLDLQDRTYGWPLEMVLQAGRAGLRVAEVPVQYRRRVGTSKVTGSIGGTTRATTRMLGVLWRYRT